MLEQHLTENAEVALTLSRLTEERQQLQSQVKELEEQLKISAKSQVKITNVPLRLPHLCMEAGKVKINRNDK
jgi:uncharacterized protein YlxW (UPF0749 family)